MCNKTDFFHAHVHTMYSPDGMGRIDDLVAYAASLGQTHLAMTDHGTMAGMVNFYLACKNHKITPVFGNEMYLHAFDEEPGKPKVTHITLLARTNKGFDNLIRLNNAAHVNTFQRRSGAIPLMTYDMLGEYAEGLIVLTGCVASAIHLGDYNFGYSYVEQLINLVGRKNVYGELMFTMEGQNFHDRVIDISNSLSVPTVITNDCHFIRPEHAELHPYLVKSRKGFNYESSKLFVMSYDQMKDMSLNYVSEKVFNQSVKTLGEIARSIEPVTMDATPMLPHTDEPKEQLLSFLLPALEADKQKNPFSAEERQDRYDKEILVIDSKGYWDYFFILNDLMQFCHENGIRVNVRGSAGGCYILYLLKITPVDPIRYGLLFERFLNQARGDSPDVDCDIEIGRREDVLEYAKKRWDMIGVANYATYGHKSLVHDLCRILELPKDLEIQAADGDENSVAFKKLCENHLFKQGYDVWFNQIRHRGKHAGAIASINVVSVPVEKFNSDSPVIALTEGSSTKELSKVGLVKYDILGVQYLDFISQLELVTGVKAPEDLDNYPVEVFDLLCRGDLTGIFQLGASPGIKDVTLKVQPRKLEDIAMISAIYRPGFLDNYDVEKLPEYKANPRKIHPLIDKVLEDSSSTFLYQEAVMEVFRVMQGGTLEDADLARRFLSPKSPKIRETQEWKDAVADLKIPFIAGGNRLGIDENVLESFWEEIVKTSTYLFNKSHAFSYAYLSLVGAWYKTFYPSQFYTVLLQMEKSSSNTENVQKYIFDAINSGLTISTPHINSSTTDFVLEDGVIYLPLDIIKGLGTNNIEKILSIRKNLGRFKTYRQMQNNIDGRTMNKTVRAKLYYIGAFKGIDGEPSDFGIDTSLEFSSMDLLGFVIPDSKIIKEINKYSSNPNVEIGIITSIVHKKTKAGKPMTRVNLAPEGGFWYYTDDNPSATSRIDKGDLVRANTTDYNKCINIVRYKV